MYSCTFVFSSLRFHVFVLCRIFISNIDFLSQCITKNGTMHKCLVFMWLWLWREFLKNNRSERRIYPANMYLFKVNNRNTRKRCEICSKITIKKHQNDVITFFYFLYCWLWTSKCKLGRVLLKIYDGGAFVNFGKEFNHRCLTLSQIHLHEAFFM